MISCGAKLYIYIYIYIYSQLRVTQSSKTQIFYFLSPNPNSSFPNPNLLSPFVLAVLGGGSSWHADARSTQDASSLTGSLPGRRFLVQAVEAHTGLTGSTYWSDRLELR
jgi:hypothetical protein